MYDNHTHSQYSCDIPQGKGSSVREICEKALSLGLKGVAITDHFDIDGVYDGYFAPLDHKSVMNDILEAKEEFKGRLKVFHGVELGQATHMPVESEQLLKDYPYDVVLGSVHAVRGIVDFHELDYSKMERSVYVGLWNQYIEEMLDTIKWGKFDVLTHITYPKRYYLRHGITDFPDIKNKGREYFEPILKALIENGITLECNSSGLRQPIGECLPNKDLLTFYYELGGRDISLGSDSHHARDIAGNFADAAEMLKSIGFKYQTYFENRNKNYEIL